MQGAAGDSGAGEIGRGGNRTSDGGRTSDDDARRLFVEGALGEDYPDFLTLQAYDVLLSRGD